MNGELIPCPIARRASVEPNLIFAVDNGNCVSYRQFNDHVGRVVELLRQGGVQNGDRVAFQLPNRIETLAVFWACFRLRAIACPISTRLPDMARQEIVAALEATLFEFPRTGNCAAASRDVAAHQNLDGSATATVILSSGSTGTPKAVVHQLSAHLASARASNMNIPLNENSRWLLTLPLYHVGGLAILFRCIEAGAVIVIDSRPTDLSRKVNSNSVTHASLVATQLKRVLDEHDRCELSSLEAILLGGGGTPRQLVNEAASLGLPVHATYGLSEMASQVTTTRRLTDFDERGDESEEKPSACIHAGKALSHVELRIAQDGEILVRGQSLMQGYWRAGQICLGCDEGLTPDGWLRTRDQGVIDRDGNLMVIGRSDNMFVSGGENIYPEEIEARLLELPDIRQAVVVPIPSAEFGARPIAFLETVEGIQIDDSTIRSRLRENLAKFKIPDRFLRWPEQIGQAGIKPRRRDFQAIGIDIGAE